MKNILLLGVGGNVSQGILKALRESALDLYIIGACVSEYSSGLYLCDEAVISPFAASENFIPWVLDICNSKKIDMILTGVEENILALQNSIDLIKEKTSTQFIACNSEQLSIGQSKLGTCRWLKENGCNYPKFCASQDSMGCRDLIAEIGFPVIAKPIRGKSAAGVRIIHNDLELSEILEMDDYVLEEYLPETNGEYTVGCYCDKNGILKDVIVMERRLRNGTTVYSKVVHDKAIENEARKICSKFKPTGPLNIQMRYSNNGIPVCFELNVRFSGSTAMRTNFGYKDVKAMLKEYLLDLPVDDCFSVRDGECFRYDNEFYMFDNQVEDLSRTGQYLHQPESAIHDKNFML